MDLKDFIKSSLLQTMQAIQEAQTDWIARDGRGVINPVWDSTEYLARHVQNMEFDVAVTAAKSSSGDSGGIQVLGAQLGNATVADAMTTVSRLKFVVPIVPPVQIVRDGDRDSAAT